MKKLVMALGVFAGFFALAGFALAQSYVPLAPLPGTVITGTDSTDLSTYLTGMIKLAVALGGALAVVMLVIGGTQYVAAGINPSAKGDAKDRIMNALIGLTLVLTSYLILNSINPNLVAFNFSLSPVATNSVSTTPLSTTFTPPATPPLTTPSTPPSATPTVPPPSTTPTAPPIIPSAPNTAAAVAAATLQAQQAAYNAQINPGSDFSIILNCAGNPTCSWYSLTDLNHDGKTDSVDLTLFGKKGGAFDVNQSKVIELGNAPAAKSCFFRMSTANIQAMLPGDQWGDNGSGMWGVLGSFCGSGGGGGNITGTPSLACNGSTWIKSSSLGSQCAMDSGFMDMAFGFAYGAGSEFSRFQALINSAASGSSINLTTLFANSFFTSIFGGGFFGGWGGPTDQYVETDVGKLTYATIAQYDLNNDGVADFGAGGADMTAFNSCIGQAISGACASTDFNQDGVIDNRDLGFVKFMLKDVLGGSTGIQFVKWTLNWFESMMFDPMGYNDQQIIKYCIGHAVTQKCAVADVNGTRAQLFTSCSGGSVFSNCGINNVKVDNADLTDFNTEAAALDFNADGKVNLK